MKTTMDDRISLSEYQRAFLSRIIAIPSVGGTSEEGAPYGREPRKVLQTFLDEAKAKGFRTGVVGDRAGWAEIGQGDRLLGIICHLDVVPVGEGWDSDPFALCFREDESGVPSMYARGVVDDKGPACAAFFAMHELVAENRIPDDCRVRLILGTDEERTCSCIQYYAKHAEIPDFSITPDSVFPVIYSEKGIMQFRLSGESIHDLIAIGGSAVNIVPASAMCKAAGKTINVTGKAAHASKPELGTNAIELLAKAMEEDAINLNDYPVIKFVHDFDAKDFIGYEGTGDYGELTYNIGMLKAGENGCELRIDLRIPYGKNHDKITENLTKKADEYGLSAEVTLDLPPFFEDRNSKGVRILTGIWKRHIDKFTGFKEAFRDVHTEPKVVGVGTYARHIPNTIAFGIQAPWQTDQCHQANEHVSVNDFLQWIQIIKEYISGGGNKHWHVVKL